MGTLWGLRTMDYDSALKRNALSRRNLKYMRLSGRSQSEKATGCESNYMEFWKMPKYGDSKSIRGFQGLIEVNIQRKRTFAAMKILCLIL